MTTYPLHVQREVDRRWAHLVGPAANLVREASAEYVAVRHRADAAAEQGGCFLIALRREPQCVLGWAPESQPVRQPGFRPPACPEWQPGVRPWP